MADKQNEKNEQNESNTTNAVNEAAVEKNEVLSPEEFAALKLNPAEMEKSLKILVKDITDKRTAFRAEREEYVKKLKAAAGGKQEVSPVEKTKTEVLQGKMDGVVDSDTVRENIREAIETMYRVTIDENPWYAVALSEIFESLLFDVRYIREFALTSVSGIGKDKDKPATNDETAEVLSEKRRYLQRAIGSANLFEESLRGFVKMGMLPPETNIPEVPNLKGLPDDIKTPGTRKVKFPEVSARMQTAIRFIDVAAVKPDYNINNVEWNLVEEAGFNRSVVYHLNPLLGMDKVTPFDVIAALKGENEKWESSKGGQTVVEYTTPTRLVQFRTEVVQTPVSSEGSEENEVTEDSDSK